MNNDKLKSRYDQAESATDKFLTALAANKFSAAILGAAVLVVIGLALYL